MGDEAMAEMNILMMACPDRQEGKMAPKEHRAKMGTCDVCGKPTNEMMMH